MFVWLACAGESVRRADCHVDKGPGDKMWLDLPPCVIIHGDADLDVPIELSKVVVDDTAAGSYCFLLFF